MRLDDLVTVVAGGVIASGLTLFAESIRRQWARRDADAARHAERDEADAGELLLLMGGIYDRYHDAGAADPSEEPDVRDLVADAERRVVKLTHGETRAEMNRILEVIAGAGIIWAETGEPVGHIAWQARSAANNCLGSMLRGEEVEPSATIARYVWVLEDERSRYEPPAGQTG